MLVVSQCYVISFNRSFNNACFRSRDLRENYTLTLESFFYLNAFFLGFLKEFVVDSYGILTAQQSMPSRNYVRKD